MTAFSPSDPLGIKSFQNNPPPYASDPNTVISQYDPSRFYADAQTYGFNQALNAGQVQAAPQFALNQSTRDQLANQIALANSSQTQQSGYLNQDYQRGLAQNDLQQQQLGIQQSTLARQNPYLGTLHDLALQSVGVGELGARQQADVQDRNALSSAVTRGAVSSPGLRRTYNDINNQLSNQLSGYDIQRGQENATFAEKQAQLADQNKVLDLQAQSLNLSRDQLKTELDRGLDRLGLSTSLTISDLTDKLNSSNIQDQMLAQQIFNSALQSSDYYAQQFPGYPSNVPTSDRVNSSQRSPQ